MEKYLSDFKTSKKAWEIGLYVETPFVIFGTDSWEYNENHHYEYEYATDCVYPAYIAEQLPLPEMDLIIIEVFVLEKLIVYTDYFNNEQHHDICFDPECDEGHAKRSINEATSRLEMVIWMLENVPEAKKWYIDNGYLQEEK